MQPHPHVKISKDDALDSKFKKKRQKWTLKTLEKSPPPPMEPTRPALDYSMVMDSPSLLLHLVVSRMQGKVAAGLVVQAEVVVVAITLLFVLPMPLPSCPWQHLKLRSGAEGGPEGREIAGMWSHDRHLSFLHKELCFQLFITPLLTRTLKMLIFCATPPMFLKVLATLGGWRNLARRPEVLFMADIINHLSISCRTFPTPTAPCTSSNFFVTTIGGLKFVTRRTVSCINSIVWRRGTQQSTN
jgi:hypothetical protein